MEFAEAVARRRMVRSYLPDPVDPAALDRILEAARRVPSAGFSQGVELVVVTDKAARARLAAAAGEDAAVARGLQPWLSIAPVHVVIVVEPDAYRRRYAEADKAGSAVERWPAPYWWVDSGAALMMLLLAAANEGLGAGFLGVHAFDGLEAVIDLPDGYEAVGLVTIGKPAETAAVGSARRSRRPLHETEHSERWGVPRRPEPPA